MSHSLPAVSSESPTNIYNQTFWLAFTANLLLVAANALTFRFAEFVRFLGGTEAMTGRIIGIGLIGSLIWRLFLGQTMDRFGIRSTWIASTFIYLVGATMMCCAGSTGPELFIARVLYSIGIASMLTAALAQVQGLAPPQRRTEIIASYGAAGFLGLIVGALVGDLVFHFVPHSAKLYAVLFGLTTAMGVLHGVLGYVITRKDVHTRPAETPAVHKLFVKYWPSKLVMVALMMGLVLTVTTIFLTRYASSLGLTAIKTFFTTYALTAFLVRIMTRRWSQTASRHHLIIYGLAAHALGTGLLVFVSNDWHFLPSGIFFGIGHALLFPCLVSLGAGAFPEQYRGTGTTISLAAIDFGTMITAPIAGWIIDHYGFIPMLWVATAVTTGCTLWYAALTWNLVDEEVRPRVLSATSVKKAASRPSRNPWSSKPQPRAVEQATATTKAS